MDFKEKAALWLLVLFLMAMVTALAQSVHGVLQDHEQRISDLEDGNPTND
jgi:hypothetical protein